MGVDLRNHIFAHGLPPESRNFVRSHHAILAGQYTSRLLHFKPSLDVVRCHNHPRDNPGANRWFLQSTPVQILPPGGSICGRLPSDLPLGCLQGGFATSSARGARRESLRARWRSESASATRSSQSSSPGCEPGFMILGLECIV